MVDTTLELIVDPKGGYSVQRPPFPPLPPTPEVFNLVDEQGNNFVDEQGNNFILEETP